METEKDKWLNKIIASGEELQQLRAPNHLYKNILNAIDNPEPESATVNFNRFRLILVAASVLVVLNLGVLLYPSNSSKNQMHTGYTIDSYNLELY